MGDMHCRKCGEPWDSYSVFHEIPYPDFDWSDAAAERGKEKFLRGDGCPSCNWGEDKSHKGISTEQFLRSAIEETDDPDEVFRLFGGGY